jgi:RHS repeat-associated protein
VANGTSGAYEYNLTDHLGNVRAVINQDGNVVQTTDYYPFGMPITQTGSSTNNYLYNGKDVQEETDWLDYGARMYDATVGRWFNMDSMAENYMSITPYAYCLNNPVLFVDPDGNYVYIYHQGQEYTYRDGTLYYWNTEGSKGYWAIYDGMDNFLMHLWGNLSRLDRYGEDLMHFFDNFWNNAYLKSSYNQTPIYRTLFDDNNTILIDDRLRSKALPTEIGAHAAPVWLIIGHELAHRQYAITHPTEARQTWYETGEGNERKIVYQSEKYATHVENQLRVNAGLPLRTHYGGDYHNGELVGKEISRILDERTRESIFYNTPYTKSLYLLGPMKRRYGDYYYPFK